MRKIIILLLCCGVLICLVGCGGDTAPHPTESPPTTVSETIITEKTSPITAVEPTEKEKEPLPTESKDQATEPTTTTTEPTVTTQPKEETKPTVTTKPPVNAPCEPTEPHPEPVPRKIRKSGTGCLYQVGDNLWEGSFYPRLPNGKRKEFNVYAEMKEQCEIKLAEMIAEKKAEIAEEKKQSMNR